MLNGQAHKKSHVSADEKSGQIAFSLLEFKCWSTGEANELQARRLLKNRGVIFPMLNKSFVQFAYPKFH